MQTMIENLENGNTTTAREQANKFTNWQIRETLVDMGWSLKRATLATDWLKGRDCWQAYCDAE